MDGCGLCEEMRSHEGWRRPRDRRGEVVRCGDDGHDRAYIGRRKRVEDKFFHARAHHTKRFNFNYKTSRAVIPTSPLPSPSFPPRPTSTLSCPPCIPDVAQAH